MRTLCHVLHLLSCDVWILSLDVSISWSLHVHLPPSPNTFPVSFSNTGAVMWHASAWHLCADSFLLDHLNVDDIHMHIHTYIHTYIWQAVQGFDMYLRLDADSFLLDHIDHDIFQRMQDRKKVYGYMVVTREDDQVVKVWELLWTHEHMHTSIQTLTQIQAQTLTQIHSTKHTNTHEMMKYSKIAVSCAHIRIVRVFRFTPCNWMHVLHTNFLCTSYPFLTLTLQGLWNTTKQYMQRKSITPKSLHRWTMLCAFTVGWLQTKFALRETLWLNWRARAVMMTRTCSHDDAHVQSWWRARASNSDLLCHK